MAAGSVAIFVCVEQARLLFLGCLLSLFSLAHLLN
jgi:hypothetical protein